MSLNQIEYWQARATDLRLAAQALVDALPKCHRYPCERPATVRPFDARIAARYCDEHGSASHHRGMPEAGPLRALLALLGTP